MFFVDWLSVSPHTLCCPLSLQLAISRALVEAMGGCVFVRSSPDVGSSFYIALPTTPPSNALGVSTGAAIDAVGLDSAAMLRSGVYFSTKVDAAAVAWTFWILGCVDIVSCMMFEGRKYGR